jgi:hypothetical protein
MTCTPVRYVCVRCTPVYKMHVYEVYVAVGAHLGGTRLGGTRLGDVRLEGAACLWMCMRYMGIPIWALSDTVPTRLHS